METRLPYLEPQRLQRVKATAVIWGNRFAYMRQSIGPLAIVGGRCALCANEMTDEDAKAVMLGIADRYALLAERARAREKAKPSE